MFIIENLCTNNWEYVGSDPIMTAPEGRPHTVCVEGRRFEGSSQRIQPINEAGMKKDRQTEQL